MSCVEWQGGVLLCAEWRPVQRRGRRTRCAAGARGPELVAGGSDTSNGSVAYNGSPTFQNSDNPTWRLDGVDGAKGLAVFPVASGL